MYIGKEQPASGGLVGGGMSQDKTASHTFKCGWDGDQENRGAHAADLMRPKSHANKIVVYREELWSIVMLLLLCGASWHDIQHHSHQVPITCTLVFNLHSDGKDRGL